MLRINWESTSIYKYFKNRGIRRAKRLKKTSTIKTLRHGIKRMKKTLTLHTPGLSELILWKGL